MLFVDDIVAIRGPEGFNFASAIADPSLESDLLTIAIKLS